MWYVSHSSVADLLKGGSPVANFSHHISESDFLSLMVGEKHPLLFLAVILLLINHADEHLWSRCCYIAVLDELEAFSVVRRERLECPLP